MDDYKDQLIDEAWFAQELEELSKEAKQADWSRRLDAKIAEIRTQNPYMMHKPFLRLRKRLIKYVRQARPELTEEEATRRIDRSLGLVD